MRNHKGYVAGYNGQVVVTAEQAIVRAMLVYSEPLDPRVGECPGRSAQWPRRTASDCHGIH